MTAYLIFQSIWHRALMRGAKFLVYYARFALAAAVFAAGTVPAHAEVQPAEAQVAVVTPGSFFKIEDLHFGTIVAGTTAGSVTITPSGVRSATGGVTLWGNDHHAAEFAGRKPTQANRPVRLSVGSNSIQVTGPGAPMTVHSFRANTSPGQNLTTNPRPFQVQQSVNGAFALFVGATLDVNANQTPGTYTGTWTITLNYQ